ncbi:hypothetical protein [Litoreibacter arenae]|uniref:hypothetical protein n=1 Tax=Litoreibacter arenae TaxID=491388 RepID=UPI0012B611EA|nr:hypothetical protein [Litoreibacter arenae]
MRWFALALVLSGPALAQPNSGNEVSDEVIAFWAKNALPLAEFVERGFGMALPEDATSTEWCRYQAVTASLMYANHPNCDRLIQEMHKQGRIE